MGDMEPTIHKAVCIGGPGAIRTAHGCPGRGNAVKALAEGNVRQITERSEPSLFDGVRVAAYRRARREDEGAWRV